MRTNPSPVPSSLNRSFAQRLPYGSYPSRQFFDPDTPPIDPPTPDPAPDPEPDPSDLGDKGKATIEKIRGERREEERLRKAAEKKVADLEAAEQKRRDAEAAQQGKFEELAETRLTEITTLTTDRDGLTQRVTDLEAEVQGYRDAAEADYQTAVKALPEELRDLAPEGDLTARRTWLTKAQKAAEKVTKAAERGNPSNPRADGPAADKDDEAALKAHADAFRV